MAVRFPFQYLFAYIEMMLLTIHIVAIGIVVGFTAFIAYYLGKKDGFNSAENEQDNN